MAAWRPILAGPDSDEEAARWEKIVHEIEEVGRLVLDFHPKDHKAFEGGSSARTESESAKSARAVHESHDTPRGVVNSQPRDLAARYGYQTPASRTSQTLSIRPHSIGFATDPKDDDKNTKAQRSTAQGAANVAPRSSATKRDHQGLPKCNLNTPTTSSAAELEESEETAAEPLRKQRRITAADFRRTLSSSQPFTRNVDDDDLSDVDFQTASTPTKSTRKSPEVVVTTPPKRRGRPRKNASSVGVPTTPRTPRTPTRRSGPGVRKPDAVHPYTYPSGNVIYLTKPELEETQRDLVPVAEEVAHPPLAGLLFR